MRKRIAIVSLTASAMLCILVVFGFLGVFLGWWALGTTEMGPIPDESGGMTVSQPSREDFSSEKAWDDYQENWRDPRWNGEHPDGYRYKVASFVNEERAGYSENAFIAGCVVWRFRGEASSGEDVSLAGLVGAREFYLLPKREWLDADGEGHGYQQLMLYFDEDVDIWAKVEEVKAATDASGHDYHGNAGWAHLDSDWLPHPEDGYLGDAP